LGRLREAKEKRMAKEAKEGRDIRWRGVQGCTVYLVSHHAHSRLQRPRRMNTEGRPTHGPIRWDVEAETKIGVYKIKCTAYNQAIEAASTFALDRREYFRDA
jgi:hypothetical protein